MESGTIADSQLTASSSDTNPPGWQPRKARLNNKLAWCSERKKLGHEYLQIDLGKIRHIASIKTQGLRYALVSFFVKSFAVKYSYDGRSWLSYKEGDRGKVSDTARH